MMRRSILGLGAALLFSVPAFAQPKIPPGHQPPAGLCRIWLAGVPPGRQPAATDCATAVRTRPYGAQVLFGGDRGRASDVVNVAYDPQRPCYQWDPRCPTSNNRRVIVNRAPDRRSNDCYSWDPRCVQQDRRTIDARERARREMILRQQRERDRRDHGRSGNRDRGRSDYCLDRDHNARCDYRNGGRR